VPVRRESLQAHLTNEIHLLSLSDEDLALAEVLIGSLDDRGYLATPLADLAELTGVSIAEIERMLAIVQTLDPPGIGARDLRECLLIQIKAKGQVGGLAWRIVDEQFENLKNNKRADIGRALKVTPEQVQEAIDSLSQLSPKPGLEVSDEEVKYVVPDLLVERVDEQYVVLLNDKNVPRLRINQAYEAVLKGQRKVDATERDYIKGKLNSARWLIQTIEQRRRTMIKVMTCIIQEQREFFDKGIQFLRPLTLQQVARQIGMHESTVSRVTTNKYVQTPRGVFELKFFFSAGCRPPTGRTSRRRPRATASRTSSPRRIRRIRTPTRRSPRCFTQKASRSRAARSPSTASISRSCPPGSAGGSKAVHRLPRGHAAPGRPAMQIHTTCRNTRMTPALKRVLEERLAKLERFQGVREAHVVLIAEKYRQTAEIVLKTKGKEFVCRAESRDMAASIEDAVNRLERQLKKLKEKRTTQRLHDGTRTNGDESLGAVRSAARAAIGRDEEKAAVVKKPSRKAARVAQAKEGGDALGPAIVAAKPHPKPLSLEEATLELTSNGDEFLAFVNAATEELNVLYRRKDGDLGWIERGGRRRPRG
jgi:RNA polymerase sigma-54 factor